MFYYLSAGVTDPRATITLMWLFVAAPQERLWATDPLMGGEGGGVPDDHLMAAIVLLSPQM